MKTIISSLLVSLGALSFTAVASADTEVGLGVDLSDFNTLYVPININDNWRVEPFVSYRSDKQNRDDEDYKQLSESRRSELGLGVYKVLSKTENLSFYSGLTVAYVEEVTDQESYRKEIREYDTYTYTSVDNNDYDVDMDGMAYGLHIGIQYDLTSDIELAVEIQGIHSHIDGKQKDLSTSSSVRDYTDPNQDDDVDDDRREIKTDSESTRINTRTNFIIRYYF